LAPALSLSFPSRTTIRLMCLLAPPPTPPPLLALLPALASVGVLPVILIAGMFKFKFW
jgi:hypothetical protein